MNAMSRETVLRQYLETVKEQYSHILIDCQPSLGMLTVNALAAAGRIIIPVQAEYLPAKGLEQLLSTIGKVKRQLNPKLQVDGILLTMVDNRTILQRKFRHFYGIHTETKFGSFAARFLIRCARRRSAPKERASLFMTPTAG